MPSSYIYLQVTPSYQCFHPKNIIKNHFSDCIYLCILTIQDTENGKETSPTQVDASDSLVIPSK